MRSFLVVLINLLAMLHGSISIADDFFTVTIDDEIEIDILQIGESAPRALIWFACNQGDQTEELNIARKLSAQGYTVYFPDMLSAHFLSPTPSNIARVPQHEVVKVVQQLIDDHPTGNFFLVGGARAAVPLLKGLADPAMSETDRLLGALLITPRILSKKPEPGSVPVYIKEAGLSRHPIRILEGERTPNRWGLPHLTATLSRSGSNVDSDLIKGVRGFFYLRGDKTAQEIKMTAQLDQIIHENIQILRANHP